MAVLAVQDIVRTGIVRTLGAIATGDTFLNNGRVFLEVNNASGGSITVTVQPSQTVDGQAVTARTVTVAASATKLIGPFPPEIYNDPSTGMATVTLSSSTSVTAAAIRLS